MVTYKSYSIYKTTRGWEVASPAGIYSDLTEDVYLTEDEARCAVNRHIADGGDAELEIDYED